MLYLLGKKNNPVGTIHGSYQEPTWGDTDKIEKIAIKIQILGDTSITNAAIKVSGALTALGDTPKHFQTIRNACIHLDKDNMQSCRNDVIPYYAIAKIDYPTEVLFATELITGKPAIVHWIDELIAVLQLVG